MNWPKINLLIFFIFFTFILSSCNENLDDEGTRYNNSNFPAIGNTVNTFAFAVAADNFTFYEKYPVTFNSNSITLGLTLTNYRNGTGRMNIINSGDSVYYSISLNNNIALGNVNVTGGVPKWIGITLSDFTGQLSIGIAGR